MKRIVLFIAFLTSVVLNLRAQEAFYIYRNDGEFNAFFYEEVDSILYSQIDLDSLLHDEYVVQEVYTADSIYRIPLAAIDSVGFVQPETKYREGVTPLTGTLFDYLVSADGMKLTFDISLPVELTPVIGDKLVTTEISDKLPYGFMGQVHYVTPTFAGIEVQCDSINLEDALLQFYGIYEIGVADDGEMRQIAPRKKAVVTTTDYDFPIGPKKLPPIELSGFITEKSIFDINAKNTLEITFNPCVAIKVTCVVDGFKSHTKIHAVTTVDVNTELDMSGEASKDWKKSFLPKTDFILPLGIPFYFDIGVKATLSGEIAIGFTIDTWIRQVTDITWYPVSLIPLVGAVLSPIINRVDGQINIATKRNICNYFGARAELKIALPYLRIGIPFAIHEVAWVGGEFEGGVKLNGEFMFDLKQLLQEEPSTDAYDALKDMAKIDLKHYRGAHFVASVFDDHYTFKVGEDFDTPGKELFKGGMLPMFSGMEAKPLGIDKAEVAVNTDNPCIIPYTLGISLYDEEDTHVATELKEEKYWSNNPFSSYGCTFKGLKPNKKYKAYPVIKIFDKYEMLASPSIEVELQVKPMADDVEDVTPTGSVLNGHIDSGYEDIGENLKFGFIYSTDKRPSEGGNFAYTSLDGSGRMSATVDGLMGGTTYYYQAFVCVDGEYIYSENIVSFTTPLPVKIAKVELDAAAYSPDGFTSGSAKYGFKYTGVVYARITDNTNVEDWGYVYVKDDGTYSDPVSLKAYSSAIKVRQTFYRNGPEATVKIKGYTTYGGVARYGEEQTFSLTYPSGNSSLSLTNCTYLGTEENVTYNGRKWGYKSSFRFEFTATEAYWLSVKTQEMDASGSGWSKWSGSLSHEAHACADGSNAFTVNYYYDTQNLSGTYNVRLLGTDATHGKSYTTTEYVSLEYGSDVTHFGGCTLHVPSSVVRKEVSWKGFADEDAEWATGPTLGVQEAEPEAYGREMNVSVLP